MGHRGALYEAIEYTVSHFQACADIGCDGMEDDVEFKDLDIGNRDKRSYAALLGTDVDQLCVNRPEVLLQTVQSVIGRFTRFLLDRRCDNQPLLLSRPHDLP